MGLQTRPQAEGLQKSDGLVEQRDGASPPGSLGGAAADDVEPGLGHAEGRGQPRQPRPRDQDVRGRAREAHRHWSSSGLPAAILASADFAFAIWETAPCNFDKAEAIRSSQRRRASESRGRRTGQGMSIEKRPVDVASAAGFSVHLFTASGGAVAVLALYAAIERHFADLLRLAWARLFHRRNRRHAREGGKGANHRGDD